MKPIRPLHFSGFSRMFDMQGIYRFPRPAVTYGMHVHHAADIGNGLLRDLYELWDAKRGNRIAPARSDFSVVELKPWLGHIAILDGVHSPTDIRFRLYGSHLTDIFGFDLTRKTVLEAVVLTGDRPLIEYEEVSRSRKPIYVSRFSPSIRDHIQVDKLALPLISDGVVDQILAAIYLSQSQ